MLITDRRLIVVKFPAMRSLLVGMMLLQGCVRFIGYGSADDAAGSADDAADSADDSADGGLRFWVGVSSAHLAFHCDEADEHRLAGALDGTGEWRCNRYHQHWLELDLGRSYTVKKIRSRSNEDKDPVDVDVYVSETRGNWGPPVLQSVTVWQDASGWVEVVNTPKVGRYVRFVIDVTEDGSMARIEWGNTFTSFPILDIEVSNR